MEITRNVVLDLLPLYLADEVSADTRVLVEKYLNTDPELADLAEQSKSINLTADIPIPLTMEDKMEAYKEAKRLMFWRTVIIAVLVSFSILALLALTLLAFFMLSS
jgi:hypothetical protein